MKKIYLALGICTAVTSFAQQNQPDSIHIVLHENQNGNIRVLDTIVPLGQEQALFTWMQTNGWEAPPPPPSNGEPMMFEHEIVINGDSMPANGQRMVFVTIEGDSMLLPPPPPMPPGAPGDRRQMVVIGDDEMPAPGEGNVMIMRHPMPPPPGCDVTVNVTEKDTIINGETRKMIIKTERVILPKNPPVPPTPPTPPANGKNSAPGEMKRDLVAYPNPTNGMISVEFDVAPKEKTTLRVLDMNGKVVYSEEIADEQGKHIYREINLSGKGKGSYTVEVKSAKKVIAEKVILQ
jgi:hypothetical protein